MTTETRSRPDEQVMEQFLEDCSHGATPLYDPCAYAYLYSLSLGHLTRWQAFREWVRGGRYHAGDLLWDRDMPAVCHHWVVLGHGGNLDWIVRDAQPGTEGAFPITRMDP